MATPDVTAIAIFRMSAPIRFGRCGDMQDARGCAYARRVQVRETNLKQLVQGEKQFRVPLWQRQYTWRLADHRLLWREIMEQYTRSADGAAPGQSGHFL